MLRSSAVTPVYATRSVNGHLAAVSHAHLTRRNGTDVCARTTSRREVRYTKHHGKRIPPRCFRNEKRRAEAVCDITKQCDRWPRLLTCMHVGRCMYVRSLDESGRDHGITIEGNSLRELQVRRLRSTECRLGMQVLHSAECRTEVRTAWEYTSICLYSSSFRLQTSL